MVVDVNGIRLTYQRYGIPEAPSMVFVHGLFANALDWADIVPAFSDRYNIFALNLRGHATSAFPGEYSFDLMAQDLIGFLDALKLDQAILVGHSLGGIVSFFVAASHPHRVAMLVMEDAAVPRPGGAPFDFGDPPTGPLPYDWRAVTGIVGELNNPDPTWWDRASLITAPTLVIAGGPTSHVPHEWNAGIAARIPNSKLVTIDGGHLVHRTRSRQFITEVTHFLSSDTQSQ